MLFKDYIEEVKKTCSTSDKENLHHGVIGISTEAGELLDSLKKHIFYKQDLDKDNMMEELGDLMWYIALTIDTLGFTMNEILMANVRKLRRRYPGGKWTEKDCMNRSYDDERKAMLNE